MLYWCSNFHPIQLPINVNKDISSELEEAINFTKLLRVGPKIHSVKSSSWEWQQNHSLCFKPRHACDYPEVEARNNATRKDWRHCDSENTVIADFQTPKLWKNKIYCIANHASYRVKPSYGSTKKQKQKTLMDKPQNLWLD